MTIQRNRFLNHINRFAFIFVAVMLSDEAFAEYGRAIQFKDIKLRATYLPIPPLENPSTSASPGGVVYDLTKNAEIGQKKLIKSAVLSNYFNLKLYATLNSNKSITVTEEVNCHGQNNWATINQYNLQNNTSTTRTDIEVCKGVGGGDFKKTYSYKAANINGAELPGCPYSLPSGHVIQTQNTAYAYSITYFSSVANLTNSTSTQCTYQGEITTEWVTAQNSGSSVTQGSHTYPLSKFQ